MFRLKWFLRIFFGVLIAISLRVGWKIGASTWANAQGQKELAQVFAETATTDPDWQFDSLSKSRKIPPPEKNSAQTLSRVASLIPSNLNPELPAVMEPYRNSKQVQVDCNRRPSDEAITLFRRDAARAKDAINLARNLKDLPEGNQVVSIASNWLNTELEGAGQVRTVSLVLQLATIVSVADGDREAAADYLIALLNSSRSIGDEAGRGVSTGSICRSSSNGQDTRMDAGANGTGFR